MMVILVLCNGDELGDGEFGHGAGAGLGHIFFCWPEGQTPRDAVVTPSLPNSNCHSLRQISLIFVLKFLNLGNTLHSPGHLHLIPVEV